MIYPAVFILLLFIAVIILIMSDAVDHMVAALLGGSLAIIYFALLWKSWGAVNHPELFSLHNDFGLEVFTYFLNEWVDWGTIIVIFSMMIITEISKDSGLFQFIAIKAIRLSKGNPRRLLTILCALSFAMCTVLTQITTILIIGSLTIVTCDALETRSFPYLISIAMVSNVGGITTIISSVPSMLIAGASGLTFYWFIINMMPLGLILLGLTILIVQRIFAKDFSQPDPERIEELMAIDAWEMVPERGVFYRTAILFIIIVIGFIIMGSFGLSFMVAFGGALAFILFSGVRPSQILREVEWTALFFFIGLFILVGVMEEFQILVEIGNGLQILTLGNPILATIVLLWVTGMTSGLVDNIPVALTLIPVVGILGTGPNPLPTGPLWAALMAGAVLGGCLTPIASAANVLAVSLAEKEERPIPFGKFLLGGVILTFVFLFVSTGYLLLRVFIFPIAGS